MRQKHEEIDYVAEAIKIATARLLVHYLLQDQVFGANNTLSDLMVLMGRSNTNKLSHAELVLRVELFGGVKCIFERSQCAEV